MASLFTRIIEGEIPAYKIYEDERSLAFLDIHPIQEGHVLVVSKAEVDNFEDLEDEDYQAVMATVKRVARKIKQEYKPTKVGVIIEGFEVPHAHVKVFPINSEKELRHLPGSDDAPSQEELEATAQKLKL